MITDFYLSYSGLDGIQFPSKFPGNVDLYVFHAFSLCLFLYQDLYHILIVFTEALDPTLFSDTIKYRATEIARCYRLMVKMRKIELPVSHNLRQHNSDPCRSRNLGAARVFRIFFSCFPCKLFFSVYINENIVFLHLYTHLISVCVNVFF